MKEPGYFQRLKDHPGIGYATVLSIAGFLAGAGNESFIWWQGGLFGLLILGGVCWSLVLWSNRK